MTPMTVLLLAITALPTPAGAVAHGESIYFGSVYPLRGDATEPTYVYERRVEERGGALISTHLTRDPSGATVVAEAASHTADYALRDYTLLQDQRGQSGTIRVDGDQVRFEHFDGTKHRSSVERWQGTVVTGPTLVGYVVRHLEELRAGKALRVRFAVLERLETIGFELRAAPAQPGQTRVVMTPSSFLVGLLVDPVSFTFETATAKLVRLEGRVPPKVRSGDRWRDLDARVEYRFVAAAYK